MSSIWILGLLLVPPTACGVPQQSFSGDAVRADVSILCESLPQFGFMPVRLAVENHLERELEWDVTVADGSQDGGVFRTRVVFPAARRGERVVLAPVASPTQAYAGVQVSIRGTGIGNVDLRLATNGGLRAMVPWAVSNSVEPHVRARLTTPRLGQSTLADTNPGGMPRASVPNVALPLVAGSPNLTAFDPAEAGTDWRAWGAFGRVVLTDDEFAACLPGARLALQQWVALGGHLYLVPPKSRVASSETYGAGEIVRLGRPLDDIGGEAAELFGRKGITFTTGMAPDPSELSAVKTGLSDRVAPAKSAGDWLIFFFIGFAVVVGPVNLFAIAPIRRRHRVFLTVPLFSLGAAAVLMAIIYVQDGVGGDGARRALVVLLPRENQAAVFQDQVTRTGLIFASDFALGDDVLCANVPADADSATEGGSQKFERSDGRAGGDWFRARNRQAQHLRRIVPTRARVELVGQAGDGAPIVQSSVGTTLRDFIYADAGGREWIAAELAPGVPVTLRRAAENRLRSFTFEFAQVASSQLRTVATSALGNDKERFVARADDFELAPIATLASARWVDSGVLLTGVVEPMPGHGAKR